MSNGQTHETDGYQLVLGRMRPRPGGLPSLRVQGIGHLNSAFSLVSGFRTRQQRNSSIFDFGLSPLHFRCPGFFAFRVNIESRYQPLDKYCPIRRC